jgi:hypothetical protein
VRIAGVDVKRVKEELFCPSVYLAGSAGISEGFMPDRVWSLLEYAWPFRRLGTCPDTDKRTR